MHKEYAKDGLVCVSVSLDSEDRHEAAHRFLKRAGATFANYRAADPGFAARDLGVLGVPAYLVFDGDGKLVSRSHDHHEAAREAHRLLRL
jgi:hypothetical protein